MRILICPLDWGLGHASRCIPLIKALQAHGADIVIASNGGAKKLLQVQFPELTFYTLPAYGIRYPSRSALFNFSLFAPRMAYAAIVEHFQLRKIIRQEKIKLVISDNRLGCWSKRVPSFYMSHQLRFAFRQKWLNQLAAWSHYLWYKNYDELWIPDLPPPHQIAGKLVQPFRKKTTQYLGLLSQLNPKKERIKYDAMIILSGPEPQRSLVEKKILHQLNTQPGIFLIVRGLPEATSAAPPKNKAISMVNFLTAQDLSTKIAEAKMVICRSGYSSIMDLLHLNKPAILIPTPGQPEQEYLAQYHADNPLFQVAQQDDFELPRLLNQLEESLATRSEREKPKDYLQKVILSMLARFKE